jgi:UDP-glucose 4-epimerase
MFGLHYIIFRPHNVYGERQNIGDRYRNVLGIFMNQSMQRRSMTVFGDGLQKRAFSYIGDIAPVMARSIHHRKAYNQIFNIGADQPYNVLTLTKVIAETMGTPHRVKHLPARKEVKTAYASHAKLEKYFGKPPQTPLALGIAKMAAWARTVGARKSKPFRDIELRDNLPPSWRGQA